MFQDLVAYVAVFYEAFGMGSEDAIGTAVLSVLGGFVLAGFVVLLTVLKLVSGKSWDDM